MGTAWWMPASAAQLVRIGAAHFPPYTVRPEQGADTGLLPQLVEALNASQTDYQFVLVPTSIPAFRDLEQGRVDRLSSKPRLGWPKIPHPTRWCWKTEIFVAQRASGRDQPISGRNGKRLPFHGYHTPSHLTPTQVHFQHFTPLDYPMTHLYGRRGRAASPWSPAYLSDFMGRKRTWPAFPVSERTIRFITTIAAAPASAIRGIVCRLLKLLRMMADAEDFRAVSIDLRRIGD